MCYSGRPETKMAVQAFDWQSHFRFFLCNRSTEFDETWQEAKTTKYLVLPSMCFSGRSKNQDGCPGFLLAEPFSTSFIQPLNSIQRNMTERSQCPLPNVCFRPIEKTRWPSWPLICWDIFDLCSATAERNWTKLDRKKDFNLLYQVFSVQPANHDSRPCLLEFNETWKKQYFNVFSQVWIFSADRKTKMATLASDWLNHFRLFFCNRWT